eukprot:scaffold238811_cov31-Tisochrysis_lutea.AAC.3
MYVDNCETLQARRTGVSPRPLPVPPLGTSAISGSRWLSLGIHSYRINQERQQERPRSGVLIVKDSQRHAAATLRRGACKWIQPVASTLDDDSSLPVQFLALWHSSNSRQPSKLAPPHQATNWERREAPFSFWPDVAETRVE